MIVRNILDIKGAEVESVSLDMSILEIARTLNSRKIGAVVVLDADKQIKGMLSERDIVRGICQMGEQAFGKTAADLMTSEVICCSLDDTVADLMEMMTNRRIRHVPVIENGRLQGIVSIGDVVKARISEAEMEAQALKEYIVTG